MTVTDLDQVLLNTPDNRLLAIVDDSLTNGGLLGAAILDRAVQLYREGTLPERCGFLIDVVLGSTA